MVATHVHGYYCFDVLVAHLNGTRPPPPEFDNHSFPLFVTWNTYKKEQVQQLRGCIGNFNAMPLHTGLAEYALTSALRDSRFDPISMIEVPHLGCSVSLLTDFEGGKQYDEWEIGLHGIWIEFQDDRGYRRTATYLPEVMVEQGWDKVTAIDSLLRKGGFRGRITQETRKGIVLTTYKSSKVHVMYDEWIMARRDKGEKEGGWWSKVKRTE